MDIYEKFKPTLTLERFAGSRGNIWRKTQLIDTKLPKYTLIIMGAAFKVAPGTFLWGMNGLQFNFAQIKKKVRTK